LAGRVPGCQSLPNAVPGLGTRADRAVALVPAGVQQTLADHTAVVAVLGLGCGDLLLAVARITDGLLRSCGKRTR